MKKLGFKKDCTRDFGLFFTTEWELHLVPNPKFGFPLSHLSTINRSRDLIWCFRMNWFSKNQVFEFQFWQSCVARVGTVGLGSCKKWTGCMGSMMMVSWYLRVVFFFFNSLRYLEFLVNRDLILRIWFYLFILLSFLVAFWGLE